MSSCDVPIKEEIINETESTFSGKSNSGVSIKEEMPDDIESTSFSIGRNDIIEEEKSQIYYGGPIHVKQEEELLIPDEVSTISIKEESQAYSDDSNSESDITVDEEEDISSDTNTLRKTQRQKKKNVKDLGNMDLKKLGKSDVPCVIAQNAGERPHQCPFCQYKAVQNSNLKRHIISRHTGKKPHQCPHCHYKSVTSDHLKRHIMFIHTGEKPYQCPLCDYKSADSTHVKRHLMLRHTDEKPH
ncbi:transcriptional repressor CTCF isoform X3 [Halyomorpha halys]|uniref:transcriptional repressor CTCF isoform X3 n=1 Tax=Halyomorpha halys TaxID=286706 RepID=UPI0034D33F7A